MLSEKKVEKNFEIRHSEVAYITKTSGINLHCS